MFKWMKKRKKGAILIEYIAVFPVLVALIFGGIELMTYLLVHGTTQEAAREGSRIVVTELRGYKGDIAPGTSEEGIDQEQYDFMMYELQRKVNTIMFNNGFLRYNADNVELITDAEGGEAACDAAMDSEDVVLCAYSKEELVNDRPHDQVVVRVKSVYKPFTNFFPFMRGRYVEGTGTTGIEAERRYEYYQ